VLYQVSPTDPTILTKLYGLTEREAEIAKQICQGKDIKEIAQQMDISYETARTHLRRIFLKTGVSRQAELIVLLGRIPSQSFGK
jgi:DNA-binding CsgD family transcriptional regulator